MANARIVTAFVGTGNDIGSGDDIVQDNYRPAVADEYDLISWANVTPIPHGEIIPQPNAYTIEVKADSSVLDDIEADPDYVVLWRNPKGPDETPSAAERGQMTVRLVQMGYTGQELANIIAPGKTRRRIADDLIALQATHKKAAGS